MLSKEELERKREELKNHLEKTKPLHDVMGYDAPKGFSDGFDACTEILWPEIERLNVVVNEINEALRETIKENETLSSSPSIAEANRLREENERLRDENEKLQAKIYFLAGVLSTHNGFTNKTLNQIFEWADKEIEGEK